MKTYSESMQKFILKIFHNVELFSEYRMCVCYCVCACVSVCGACVCLCVDNFLAKRFVCGTYWRL